MARKTKTSTAAVAALFLGARKANLLRHTRKGTAVKHLARKAWIRALIRLFPFPGDR